ncbi:hypothetical protein UPYG_G00254600 [Umbra pygmaea]|uniref:Uncharacterized protein n=1 Tax=Umbra pygmaea TaxID=75934 RepID=A0ABD0W9Q8_UMBPY
MSCCDHPISLCSSCLENSTLEYLSSTAWDSGLSFNLSRPGKSTLTVLPGAQNSVKILPLTKTVTPEN